MSALLRSWVLGGLVVGLVACGGGGGGGGGSNNSSSGAGSSGGGNVAGGGATPAAAPNITEQPSDISISDGSKASFTVHFNGTSPLSTQWKKNGIAIPGATGTSYEVESVTLADDKAEFTVTISNSAGSVTSASATLNVYAAVPSIVTAPQAQMILTGTTATFSAVATGTPPLTFQWLKNDSAIPGATSATYITPSATLSDNGSTYKVQISNSAGSIISGSALLQVSAADVAPSILAHPQDITTAVGGVATFSVTATGTNLNFQWRRNSIDIAGANLPVFTLSPVTILNNHDSFSVVVTNTLSSVSSQQAKLTTSSSSLDLIAGQLGGFGNIDGLGSAARFNFPVVRGVDSSGNIYVVDSTGRTVRKISSAGNVSSLFTASNTLISAPDADGNFYVVNTCSIDKVSSLGTVSTFVGDPNAGTFCAYFNSLGLASGILATDILMANDGNLYITDQNHTIRKISMAGSVSTLAGTVNVRGSVDGLKTSAVFEDLMSIRQAPNGDLIVIENDNNGFFKTRLVSLSGNVTSPANAISSYTDPSAGSTSLSPWDPMGTDASGNLYLANPLTRFLLVQPSGNVLRLAGGKFLSGDVDGSSTTARFTFITSIFPDDGGGALIGDAASIRRISSQGNVNTIAGRAPQVGFSDGSVSEVKLDNPYGITFSSSGDIFITQADPSSSIPNSIRKISTAGLVSTIAGSPLDGFIDGAGSTSRFRDPAGITIDLDGNLFIADRSNNVIRKITAAGVVSTYAGTGSTGNLNGPSQASTFAQPSGIAIASNGDMYVTDTGNSTIRKISSTGVVSTFAGSPGVIGSSDGSSGARFNAPTGIIIDGAGNIIVSDTGNQLIRKITPSGIVTTIAGTPGLSGFADGANALFRSPMGLAIDDVGNIYVADSENHAIRKIAGTVVTTIAGQPSSTSSLAGSTGVKLGSLPGSLSRPVGVAFTRRGSQSLLAVTDTDENVLVSILLP